MGNVVIQNPPQYTEQIPKWDRETLADGEAMGQVIEQLANNDAYLKKELERQEHVELITLTAAGWTEESGLFVQSVAVPPVQRAGGQRGCGREEGLQESVWDCERRNRSDRRWICYV